jgi:hypothetical protein
MRREKELWDRKVRRPTCPRPGTKKVSDWIQSGKTLARPVRP